MKLGIEILLVSVGSALGGLARWGVSIIAVRSLGTSFPWGTLIINLSGCLFLGWFGTFISQRLTGQKQEWLHPEHLRLMIAVGFTGAYTTFSTFEFETHSMLHSGDTSKGVLYVAASVLLGLAAVRAGSWVAGGP